MKFAVACIWGIGETEMFSFKKAKKAKKKCMTAAFVIVLVILATVPSAVAAAAMTLNPKTAAFNSAVTVTGTGFGATKAVGIGLGAEVAVTGEVHNILDPTGLGPFTAVVYHYPIKPGSFSFHCNVSSVESDYTDKGDGTLNSSSPYAVDPFVNYVNGTFGRSTNSAWDGFTVVFTANYTYYMYNVTSAASITTSASGAFTALILVPAVPDGTYNVTAVDQSGNKSTATLTVVGVIPEGTNIGILLAASVSAVIVGSRYLRKRPTSINLK
jgi:hypothetical protein